ncbi:MAG: SUMF1/EgtB/PvdO family nonheme iron enzyme [Polyangiaceae bacterium]
MWAWRCALAVVPLAIAWIAVTFEAVGGVTTPGAKQPDAPPGAAAGEGPAAVAPELGEPGAAAPAGDPAIANLAPVLPATTAAPPAEALGSVASLADETALPAPPPCPPEMVQVGKRACIDRWEAHLVVVDGDTTSPWPHYQRLEKGRAYQARSAAGAFPQGYISRVEAAAACKGAGKRLCRMSEWRQACEGSTRRTYPYGGRRVEGRCNSGKPHLLQARFGMNPALWKYDEHFNDPSLNQLEGWLAASGAYDGCVGDLGVYDLVGNLHEWVADTVDEGFMERLDSEGVSRRRQPWHTGNGVFLGGFFSTLSQLGSGCRFTTVAHEPAYHDYSTGFRCCAAAVGVEETKKGPSKTGPPGVIARPAATPRSASP